MGIKGTVEERASRPKDLLPEGIYTVKLLNIKLKPVPNADGDKLLWKFKILEPQEWSRLDDGSERFVYGECWKSLNTRDDCVWRNWHAAMLDGKDIGIGEEIDTDHVIGLMAIVRVQHRGYVPKGETEQRFVAEVAEVLPLGTEVNDEPPY